MASFNALMSVIFDVLLAPLGHRPAAFDLLIWPVLAGVVALLVYKHVSNQKGITRAKNRIQVHLLEIVIYRDDLVGVLVSTAKALAQNAVYVGYNILPMLVMILPMTAVLVQLVANYAYAPLPPGEPVLIEAKLQQDATVKPADVSMELPEGVTLDAPPVRTSDGVVVWRVVPAEGDHVLTLRAGGETQAKALAVGGGPRKIPVLRTATWEAFLYPGEDALTADSAFESIRVKYPTRSLAWLPDGEGGILAWFFIYSLAAGFLLKDRFGVTL